MVVDGAGFFPIRNGSLWSATVEGSTNSDNPLLRRLDFNGLLSSRVLINHFTRALKQAYPASTVAKDGQAVNVWLDSYNLGLDVVPCFHIVPHDGSQDVYYIPAGSNSDGWLITNPKVDERISEWLHKHHNEKLKPVIRLVKIWNRVSNDDRLRSYHIETMAWRIFANSNEKITDYGMALLYFFDKARELIVKSCPDATGLGGPVDTQLSQADRFLTFTKLQEIHKILLNGIPQPSLLPLSSNRTPQLAAWRKVYGDTFGTSP